MAPTILGPHYIRHTPSRGKDHHRNFLYAVTDFWCHGLVYARIPDNYEDSMSFTHPVSCGYLSLSSALSPLATNLQTHDYV